MINKNLRAIALIKQKNWHAAHDLIQHEKDELACLIHGYLHRIEGDVSNANYWYNRAGKVQSNNSQAEELELLYQQALNETQKSEQ